MMNFGWLSFDDNPVWFPNILETMAIGELCHLFWINIGQYYILDPFGQENRTRLTIARYFTPATDGIYWNRHDANCESVSSKVYFYRLQAGNYRQHGDSEIDIGILL